MADELRIAIRYNTLDVPGLPSNRARQVADDFATSKLSRPFSNYRDFIHCPSDFDSSVSQSVWILCDFNVHDRLPDLQEIPTQFWKVNYGNNQLATFKPHQTNAKHFLKSYPWGGRDNEWEYRSQQKELISERDLRSMAEGEIIVGPPQETH
ncbi:hypothetical protein ONS95_003410 [Cadophora gregata]|uniref:uncharacterized protein n=1 Tax=Cadophora gregata TaxID=51156 RepID=UPI0026DAC6E0|nr:uncharacterized protein ONS95_003410 [Cadophora gregata]KAK0108615.1 hypothetical protein ONS95_003410 [Cadophora gregata]